VNDDVDQARLPSRAVKDTNTRPFFSFAFFVFVFDVLSSEKSTPMATNFI
jgi:hypothetical protein